MEQDDQYNERQYQRMLEAIDNYEKGSIGLAKLVGDLMALFRGLEAVTDQWLGSLEDAWWVLEQVYAEVHHEKRNWLSEKETEEVRKALVSLKGKIHDRGGESNRYAN
jgi:hypothetical protein